ncbi:hypothetical protein [Streptomyces sp. NBC_01217]|uniref:hypothetical protein n=1 Tax=Streptomyces sp. NBC_01217 TaxID=2903779 RepID=UPI002E0F8E56|nr:hypothetical protein OG507_01565 [Streptomyces sp. NBC_01217]
MSAVGSSADNALAKPFNATFKRETPQDVKNWTGEREARPAAFRCPHGCKTQRRRSRLGYRSSAEYETPLAG